MTVLPPFALEYKSTGQNSKTTTPFWSQEAMFLQTTTFEPNYDGAIEYLTTFKGS